MLESERGGCKVWLHTANFFPYTALVKNETLVKWAKESGADGVVWIAARRPAHEVLKKDEEELKVIFDGRLGAGHVIFNPYADFFKIITRRPDPLRPKERIAFYNLLLSKELVSRKALEKLQRAKPGLAINVYPPFNGKEIYERYQNPRYQTLPAFFNDERNAKQIVEAVQRGDYSSVCVDLYHFQEATNTGRRPFGQKEDDLKKTLETFHNAGVLKEVHVQPGRLINVDDALLSRDDLNGVLAGSYNTRMGRLLKFLVNELGFAGPYTVEIDSRAIGKFPLALPSKILEVQKMMVEYIRAA
ncbi:MAG: hypothetical protein Q8P80_00130 [Candidatus Levybacteria bacterium]|nr:hypothetical protein [Candidatus Levybacteria bacterium]